jgi:hypothetical protein
MRTIQGVQATGAGATTANALTGNPYAVAPFNGVARFYLTAEAAGESRVTIYIGARLISPESTISRQARPPLIPDDFFTTAAMRAGEQIVIQHRNTGAGSNNLFWRVDFTSR